MTDFNNVGYDSRFVWGKIAEELDHDKKFFDTLCRHHRELSEVLPQDSADRETVRTSIHYRSSCHLLRYGGYITMKYLHLLARIGWIQLGEFFEFSGPDTRLQVEWRVTPGENGELAVEKIGEYRIIIGLGEDADIDDHLKWSIGYEDLDIKTARVDGSEEAAMTAWINAFTALVKRYEVLVKSTPTT